MKRRRRPTRRGADDDDDRRPFGGAPSAVASSSLRHRPPLFSCCLYASFFFVLLLFLAILTVLLAMHNSATTLDASVGVVGHGQTNVCTVAGDDVASGQLGGRHQADLLPRHGVEVLPPSSTSSSSPFFEKRQHAQRTYASRSSGPSWSGDHNAVVLIPGFASTRLYNWRFKDCFPLSYNLADR